MKKMNAILIASLCLNLVLIGLMAGGAWKGHQKRPKDRTMDEIGMVMTHLPKESGRELRMQFREILNQREGRQNRGQKFADILSEMPFNSQKLADHLAESRQSDTEISEIAQVKLVDVIATMTDEERSHLAEQIKKRGM